jgi:hypothetical protein
MPFFLVPGRCQKVPSGYFVKCHYLAFSLGGEGEAMMRAKWLVELAYVILELYFSCVLKRYMVQIYGEKQTLRPVVPPYGI